MRATRVVAAVFSYFACALTVASCVQGSPTRIVDTRAVEPAASDDPIATGGASGAYRTCVDMFVACQLIGGGCTRGYPGCDRYGQTSCGTCLEACLSGASYPPACQCYAWGFE